jgi:mono/diheme cytochrome c family protein
MPYVQPSRQVRTRLIEIGGAVIVGCLVVAGVLAVSALLTARTPQSTSSANLVRRGQQIFRFDTFGDERQWTDTLRLHEVIQTAVDPVTALGVGLKVDSTVLPADFLTTRDLTSPETTVELLALDAVIGLKATVRNNEIERLGVTCALCHSNVDNSVIPGIGRRLDGWANRDLNPGAIIALSPALTSEQKAVYNSWGPGRYDPRFNIDGINGPVMLPPIYGLADVDLETYTGDGPVPYWNNYVAVTQMGGQGVFIDPRIGVKVVRTPDLVHSKLPALKTYQLSLPAPAPPPGSFDAAAASRGAGLFNGAAACSSCHLPGPLTDINERIWHAPDETDMDPLYASRTATKLYRTTPLRALWQHPPYFHDGSAPTLEAVVDHYDGALGLGLSDQDKADLVEYLKTL